MASRVSGPPAVATASKKFNKLYLGPEGRKTRIQRAMDIVFGRQEVEKLVPRDYFWRMTERNPRRVDMPEHQDWPSVWPAAQSFRASAVPIPIRMGYVNYNKQDKLMPRPAYGNLELVKIPNFLHLTPPHVQRHCEAIKKFCTEFPAELKDPAVKERHMPLRLTYRTYVHQGTDIRDPRARDVTARFRLSSFRLRDTHAYNKCRQLLGPRYDEQTDQVTIEANRCPMRRQNIDYAHFLLTALYHESHHTEPWEHSQIAELLEMRERERLEAESEPESPAQAELMMKASERRSNGEEAAAK